MSPGRQVCGVEYGLLSPLQGSLLLLWFACRRAGKELVQKQVEN